MQKKFFMPALVLSLTCPRNIETGCRVDFEKSKKNLTFVSFLCAPAASFCSSSSSLFSSSSASASASPRSLGPALRRPLKTIVQRTVSHQLLIFFKKNCPTSFVVFPLGNLTFGTGTKFIYCIYSGHFIQKKRYQQVLTAFASGLREVPVLLVDLLLCGRAQCY